MIINGKIGASDAEQFFESAADKAEYNGFCGELEVNYHLAYIIAHIAHHFAFYGAGIKLMCDVAVMLKYCGADVDKTLNILKEAGLEQFSKLIFTLCEKWFGVGRDFGIDTEKTELFLLGYGAFGNVNRNNAAVIERRELEEGRNAGSFATRLRLLFPPYEKMKDIDYLRFIENRPYLTPFAWVYRLFYNLKYKRSFVTSSVKAIGSDETNSEAKEELGYFKEIGLL